MNAPRSLILGTRASALARWQTDWVRAALEAAWPGLVCKIEIFSTRGDRDQHNPLPAVGGKGLFTAELEEALRAETIDLAVHSLKDLPVEDAPGLTLGALCTRADARDVLIARPGLTLATLPHGARIGTSSPRRAAQLRALRPDLVPTSIRGNVDTRLRKLAAGTFDAIILAAAGVTRLDFAAHITEHLTFDIMLPAPGQGALAVQCRAADNATRTRLAALDHAPTRAAVTAERAFLAGLGGGCAVPIAAYAEPLADALHLRGLVARLDGQRVVRVSGTGTDPLRLGAELAALAHARGAQDLLQ